MPDQLLSDTIAVVLPQHDLAVLITTGDVPTIRAERQVLRWLIVSNQGRPENRTAGHVDSRHVAAGRSDGQSAPIGAERYAVEVGGGQLQGVRASAPVAVSRK